MNGYGTSPVKDCYWYIKASENGSFCKCSKCDSIMVNYEIIDYGNPIMCLWCEIHKDESNE